MAGAVEHLLDSLRAEGVDHLVNGGHYTQREFHQLYERMPPGERWELIEGIAYMASPTGRPHAGSHFSLTGVLSLYVAATPGIEGLNEVSTILGPDGEVQPDIALLITAAASGRTRRDGDLVTGGPEFVVEIAVSSRAIDLGRKKQAYFRAGVIEYVVMVAPTGALHWFLLQDNAELKADEQGVLRSRLLPGLWLDAQALQHNDLPKAMQTLQAGLASPEHAAFVAEMKRRLAAS